MRHVSYVQASTNTWLVYIVGRFAGHLTVGQESAYFQARSGRGRLFSGLVEAERQLSQAAKAVLERQKRVTVQ